MDARLNYSASPTAGKVLKPVMAAGRAVKDSSLPPATQELVALRVSQINGCAVCLDMHTKEAAAAGETAVRLNLVAAWREATVFTDAERAALELAEAVTVQTDAQSAPSDEVWANASKHYTDVQLGALVMHISLVNFWNRVNVATHQDDAVWR